MRRVFWETCVNIHLLFYAYSLRTVSSQLEFIIIIILMCVESVMTLHRYQNFFFRRVCKLDFLTDCLITCNELDPHRKLGRLRTVDTNLSTEKILELVTSVKFYSINSIMKWARNIHTHKQTWSLFIKFLLHTFKNSIYPF